MKQEPQKSKDDAPEPPEEHRGFVREMNRAFSGVYGYGGAAVFLLSGGVLVLAALWGALWSPLTWIAALSTFLLAFFVLRIVVRRRARRLLGRIEQYCEANQLEVDALRERYSREGLYPYFESIFEVIERHPRLSNESRDSR